MQPLYKTLFIHHLLPMSRKYQGTVIINTRGNEDNAETLVSRIGRELEAEGAKLTQIDKLGKRTFPFESKKQKDGYFVTYHFNAAPEAIAKITARLRLVDEVHQQMYVAA
jgi:small subunit ribosomal protein S6